MIAEQANEQPILQVNKLTKFFGGLAAVQNVSFEVRRGQIFGFIGPNGAGKTTLFSMIAGAQKPTSGQVLCRGKDVTGLRSFRLVQEGIARTHQNVRPFRTMSVLQNVQVGAYFGRGEDHNLGPKSAMEVLRSRLFEMELRRHQDEVGSARKMQVGSGERGSKIRTYNFRENRVTDHRIGLTLYNLDKILEGQLDPLLDALADAGGREDDEIA